MGVYNEVCNIYATYVICGMHNQCMECMLPEYTHVFIVHTTIVYAYVVYALSDSPVSHHFDRLTRGHHLYT